MSAYFLKAIGAGCLAALGSWLGNSFFFSILGKRVIIYVAPVLEELFKTSLAIFFNASIIGSHLFFGLIEFFVDLFRPGKDDLPASITSLLSHLLYGLLTSYIFYRFNSLGGAIGLAILVHFLWNLGILKLVQASGKRIE